MRSARAGRESEVHAHELDHEDRAQRCGGGPISSANVVARRMIVLTASL
jgi:hypothetical protein